MAVFFQQSQRNEAPRKKRGVFRVSAQTRLFVGGGTLGGIILMSGMVLAFSEIWIILSLLTCYAAAGYVVWAQQQKNKKTNSRINRLGKIHYSVFDSIHRQDKQLKNISNALKGQQEQLADLTRSIESLKSFGPSPAASSESLFSYTDRLSTAQGMNVSPTDSIVPRRQKAKSGHPIGGGVAPANDDMGKELSDTVVLELLRQAIMHQRIDVFLQPVMHIPQRQEMGFEVFGRIRARAGQYLPAARYLEIARKNGLLRKLDNLVLMQCLKTLGGLSQGAQSNKPYTLNISPTSLEDKAFMQTLVKTLSKRKRLAKNLIFEMTQAGYEALESKELKILAALASLGCRFSMDHVIHGRFVPDKLKDWRIAYLKMPVKRLVDEAQDDARFQKMWQFQLRMRKMGIKIIAEKLESEEQLRTILDYEIALGQGHLLGKPDLQGVYRSVQSA